MDPLISIVQLVKFLFASVCGNREEIMSLVAMAEIVNCRVVEWVKRRISKIVWINDAKDDMGKRVFVLY